MEINHLNPISRYLLTSSEAEQLCAENGIVIAIVLSQPSFDELKEKILALFFQPENKSFLKMIRIFFGKNKIIVYQKDVKLYEIQRPKD